MASKLPLTTNALTAKQRSGLLRKSRKIEQLLGSAPYLVDFDDVNERYEGNNNQDFNYHCPRRASFEPISSSALFTHGLNDERRSSTSVIRRQRNSSFATPSTHCNTYAHDGDIPMLRIAFESFHMGPPTPPASYTGSEPRDSAQSPLETLTNSPNTTTDQEEPTHANEYTPKSPPGLPYSPSVQSENNDPQKLESTSGPDEIPWATQQLSPLPLTTPDSPTSFLPVFTILSPTSVRKAKMDRLRKKLGVRIPLELVFPDERNVAYGRSNPPDESPSLAKSNTIRHSSSFPSLTCQTVNSPPSYSPLKIQTTSPKADICQEIEISSPQAISPAFVSLPPPPRPKKPKQSARHASRARRRRAHSMEVPPPVPPFSAADFKPLREKLSLILELPEEVGFDPNAAPVKVTLHRVNESPLSSRPSTAGSQLSTDGWAASAASTAPTTPTNSRPSTPKRPASYRKAPPPITDELLATLNQTILPSYHP